jgi:hypothetical protein
MRAWVEQDHTYDRGLRNISEANRHLMNLMSSARSYIDQVKQDFRHSNLEPSFESKAEKLLSEAYDSCPLYRFMEALRNHVQHFGLPIQSTAARSGDDNDSSWAETVGFYCYTKFLAENKKFKKGVLHGLDERIEMRLAVREYVPALSRVHCHLRREVDACVSAARQTFVDAIADFESINDGKAVGLTATHVSEQGTLEQQVPVLLEWDNARQALARKNRRSIVAH